MKSILWTSNRAICEPSVFQMFVQAGAVKCPGDYKFTADPKQGQNSL